MAQADTNCRHPIAPVMDDLATATPSQTNTLDFMFLSCCFLRSFGTTWPKWKSSGKLKARLTATSNHEYRPQVRGHDCLFALQGQPKFRWSLAELSTLTARNTYRFF
jgi:hypothetical protein